MSDSAVTGSTGRSRIPRGRDAAGGFFLILLGLWGGLIPFIGPYLDFAYSPGQAWTWTAAKGWLEVLPGAGTVLSGALLLGSANRTNAVLGGWLAVLAGGWFVGGRMFATTSQIGTVVTPTAVTDAKRLLLELSYFSGLGALIVFLGAMAVGRLSLSDAPHTEGAVPAVARREPVATTAAGALGSPTYEAAPEGRQRAWAGSFGDRHTPFAR